MAADLGYPASILILQEKDAPCASTVLTLIALGPIGLLACLDDGRALTMGSLHRDRDHRLPPRTILRRGHHTGKLLIWNITGEPYLIVIFGLTNTLFSCKSSKFCEFSHRMAFRG